MSAVLAHFHFLRPLWLLALVLLPVFVVPAAGDRDGYATRFKILALVLGASLAAMSSSAPAWVASAS